MFEHFLTNHIQDDIVKWTNAEITIKRQNYKQDTSTQNDTSKDFMNKLHMQLVESWLKIRPEIRTMPLLVKDKIKNVLGVSIKEGQAQPSSSNNDLQPLEAANRKRKICGLCSYKAHDKMLLLKIPQFVVRIKLIFVYSALQNN